LVEVLVGMRDGEKGRETLNKIGFSGYRPVTDVDYEVARPYMRQGIADQRMTN